ncbi:hypothetical protein [Micromonospora sp. NPDC005652]|uniref:hypothetical protein n=1 Tax=Micromonospora sp. NPDC005652 TaxID=3157046 RepID=UPI00340B59C3
MATMKERFDAAFKRLEEQGITASLVFDDRGFVTSEYLEAYKLRAQMCGTGERWVGAARVGAGWSREGDLVYADRSGTRTPIEELWFDHQDRDPSIARALVEAMQAEGFRASWSGIAKDFVHVYLT